MWSEKIEISPVQLIKHKNIKSQAIQCNRQKTTHPKRNFRYFARDKDVYRISTKNRIVYMEQKKEGWKRVERIYLRPKCKNKTYCMSILPI